MGILESLGWGPKGAAAGSASAADTETVRKIVTALDRLDPVRARFVAAFAYLLSRVAFADMEISADETREMERIVQRKGELPEEQAVLVVHIAKTQNRLFGGVENFLVAREFNQIATREEKIALLHCLFAVSVADGSVSSAEDTTIRKMASELLLDHADFIEVKSRYREFLAVLKDPAP
jgi:uncharacterized tellurite resistance protein B-like protein